MKNLLKKTRLTNNLVSLINGGVKMIKYLIVCTDQQDPEYKPGHIVDPWESNKAMLVSDIKPDPFDIMLMHDSDQVGEWKQVYKVDQRTTQRDVVFIIIEYLTMYGRPVYVDGDEVFEL